MAERLSTTHSQAHLKFRWSANAAPNLRQAIVEDVTDESEESTCKRFLGSITRDHDTTQRERHATEDRHDPPNKRARLADTTGDLTENDVSAVQLGGATGSSRGHSFHNVLAKDNARVLMGDQHIVNNNYSDSFEGINILLQRFWDAGPDERAAIVHLAASVIAVAALHVFVQHLFRVIGRIHPAAPGVMKQGMPSMLSSIGYRFAILEDAFGRIKSIDIDILTDWAAFHEELTKDFKNKPGHRRVEVARYRLFDQAYSDNIIDPRDPPPFASLFRPKAHVLMSVHFESHEVPSLSRCPKCRMEQAYERSAETTCKSSGCGLRYRAERAKVNDHQNKDDDVRSRSDSHVASHGDGNNVSLGGNARKSVSKADKDDPARFNRIIVSEVPFTFNTVIASHSERIQYGTSMLTDDLWKKHVHSANRGMRKWVCPVCGRGFARGDTVTRHIKDKQCFR